MAVPGWESFMFPVLQAMTDSSEATVQQIRTHIVDANPLGLIPADMLVKTRNKKKLLFDDRVHWAIYSMSRAGLLDSVRRGVYRLTAKGWEVLEHPPAQLNHRFLMKYPGYVEWKERGRKTTQPPEEESAVKTITGGGEPSHFCFEVAATGRVLRVWADSLIEDEHGHYVLLLDGSVVRNIVKTSIAAWWVEDEYQTENRD